MKTETISLLSLLTLLTVTICLSFSYGLSPDKMKKSLYQELNDLHVRAFLDVIAFAEGTDFVHKSNAEGYNIRYPMRSFKSLRCHPGKVVCARRPNGRRLCSSAAGRYQILKCVWEAIAERMALADFSPLNQDLAAVYLLAEHQALDDIKKGDVKTAIAKLSKIWSSFPGATYGQPVKDMRELEKFFKKRLTFHKRRG